MILVNGRVSERSFRRWRLMPRVIGTLLHRLDLCLAQSSGDAQRYGALGAPRVSNIGNLKLDVPAPPVDQSALHKLNAIIGMRDVIAAASTHAGEETTIMAAHRRLRAKCPTLLTIIAPRHPDRGPRIADAAKVAGLSVALRSRGDLPKPDIDIFIADTLGRIRSRLSGSARRSSTVRTSGISQKSTPHWMRPMAPNSSRMRKH
jgi:3-deoxy-D-manno-octulosonic-acid transferase